MTALPLDALKDLNQQYPANPKIPCHLEERDFTSFLELSAIACNNPISAIYLNTDVKKSFVLNNGLLSIPEDHTHFFKIEPGKEVVVIHDVGKDKRIPGLPAASGKSRILFYAGACIINTAGQCLGTLCVMNTKPVSVFSDEQKNALQTIAHLVACLVDMKVNNHLAIQQAGNLLEAEKKNTLLALAEQDSEKGFLTHQLQENFAQTLAATKLYLEFAEISADEANHFIQKSRDSITQVITEINQLCRSLAPATVGNPDMAEVLQDMVAEWQSQNNIYIDFICHASLDELKGHDSLALFHIIQQQLKMATYCQASEVEISLLEKDGIVIYFHINGMNFNDPDQKKELFINHIQNRTSQLGGELSFETNLDPNDVMLITIPAYAKRHTRQAADEMELKSAKFV